MGRYSLWILVALTFLTICLHGSQGSAELGPSESECQPYIAKALNELKSSVTGNADDDNDTDDIETNYSKQAISDEVDDTKEGDSPGENVASGNISLDSKENNSEGEEGIDVKVERKIEIPAESQPNETSSDDESHEKQDQEEDTDGNNSDDNESETRIVEADSSEEVNGRDHSADVDNAKQSLKESHEGEDGNDGDDTAEGSQKESEEETEEYDPKEAEDASSEDADNIANENSAEAQIIEGDVSKEESDQEDQSHEKDDSSSGNQDKVDSTKNDNDTHTQEDSKEKKSESTEDELNDSKEATLVAENTVEVEEGHDSIPANDDDDDISGNDEKKVDASSDESGEGRPEDDLLLREGIPDNLRDRKDINELLLDENKEKEDAERRVSDVILRDLKHIYENSIKPLEVLYKYRDLSNRHYGDSEIFSKSLVLLMGPWSGGKSTIVNYLTGNEYTENSLRSGAEPSPAYFNIVMHGEKAEVLDGTQLVSDWTFSGLQKFGQGLEERLRGLKLPHGLLEKVNIVEIPGILEVRKQVSRVFPFNDACQWFIDRADIILLVYDPTKLDVGPETEAILDQLKGREYQTRIILNKADLIQPEELLRVQSALIWNISPLMSSAQPPVMYTTSLWSHPYEKNSPERLLRAQERALLRDLRTAIDKRIENKIASARRFAVRVRNHAKMVDCYLTTYYNHKSLFGNKKRIADQIIENPQNYHIYEGLSTLTNISRYDLPDPEVYRDFFRLNPVYEFKKLSETCTYFRGCPINKLDVAIAYDLPDLIGKYKKMMESTLNKLESTNPNGDGR